MFEQVTLPDETHNSLGDWILRGGIALVFILAGTEKFGSKWVELFRRIGAGQWFRYFTGVVEILGAVLVLIPRTVSSGLILLACTMASAALILAFVIGRLADGVFPSVFFIGLAAFWWNRKSR
jgi:uncharacterized membrane protein YphA (DoxX/SURF4 family)